MIRSFAIIFLSVFFLISCDNGQKVTFIDDETSDDQEQVIEFTEITRRKVSAQPELNDIVQESQLHVSSFSVERSFNHVDTSFQMHEDDYLAVFKTLQDEILKNGCQECVDDEDFLLVVTTENDNCCIFEQSEIDKIDHYLLIPVHSMLWPFSPQDKPHPVGHKSANIQLYTQNYKDAYFHHGTDIVKESPEKIFNPYDGRVTKVGYYRTDEVGESEYYFEVVVQTVNGMKFEFHHTDPATVPKKIYEMEGQDEVLKAGESTGKIVFWPTPDSFSGRFFHHIHFNVIAKNGIKLNLLIMMIPQKDVLAPKIDEIYLIDSQRTKTLDTEEINEDFHVVIKVSDLEDNEIWPNPPLYSKIEIINSNDEVVFVHHGYDFIATMSENENDLVCDYYLCEIGETLFSTGNYSQRESHIVVTAFDKTGMKKEAVESELFESGEYLIKVTSCDESGNCVEKNREITF